MSTVIFIDVYYHGVGERATSAALAKPESQAGAVQLGVRGMTLMGPPSPPSAVTWGLGHFPGLPQAEGFTVATLFSLHAGLLLVP